ncbi:MAG TPA: hypothetical protein VNY83_04660, partial [Solirubrobacterales bacterium]|nr:hypothetical protein [Solirubrobacterales bacterium]
MTNDRQKDSFLCPGVLTRNHSPQFEAEIRALSFDKVQTKHWGFAELVHEVEEHRLEWQPGLGGVLDRLAEVSENVVGHSAQLRGRADDRP